jgi:hypothetical protein
MLLLLLASCEIEKLDGGTVIFYNFSPVTITELKVYASSENTVYTYTGGIKTAELHQFVLPEGIGYFFEVRTEKDGTYEGGPFSDYGTMNVIFSVDYDVLEYD